MNIVALIPARGGSKRIPGKNVKLLAGKPLLEWTIDAAQESGVFDDVCVSTSDHLISFLAQTWPFVRVLDRPREYSSDDAPDIWWVRHALYSLDTLPDAFAILRPTSPFRTADTIRRAWAEFQHPSFSSMRAVEPVRQHPGKMWQVVAPPPSPRIPMVPLIGDEWPWPVGPLETTGGLPWHSRPTQTLPTVYVQNASLEIAWSWCVTVFGSISGPQIAPFFTEGWEGFDINTPEDWEQAEAHARTLSGA